MTNLLFVGGTLLVFGFLIWIAMKAATARGVAEQKAVDDARAKAAQEAIDATQNEQRDLSETRRRLDEGTF